MGRRHSTLTALAASLALFATLPAPCPCAPELSPAEHGCCTPPPGLRAQGSGCCFTQAPAAQAASAEPQARALVADAAPAAAANTPRLAAPAVAAFVFATAATTSPPRTVRRL